jgi:hypothetical protein
MMSANEYKRKSKGELLDLAVLDIASSMLVITANSNIYTVRKDSNTNYKANNRIDRRILNYHNSLNGMYDNLTKEDQDRCQELREKVLLSMVKIKSDEPIIYEYFGAYILYTNFFGKRKKPISEDVKKYVDKNKIFELFDMVNEIVADNGQGQKLARELLMRIR